MAAAGTGETRAGTVGSVVGGFVSGPSAEGKVRIPSVWCRVVACLRAACQRNMCH